MSAYKAYTHLVARFERPSWSLLVSRWNSVSSPSDGSDTLAESFAAAHRNWTDLQARLGGLSVDKLAALTFYSSAICYQTQIANALDSRLAITPNFDITADELLNIASRLAQSLPETGANVSAIGRGGGRGTFFRRGGTRVQINHQVLRDNPETRPLQMPRQTPGVARTLLPLTLAPCAGSGGIGLQTVLGPANVYRHLKILVSRILTPNSKSQLSCQVNSSRREISPPSRLIR
ncbi:hypothetical protein PSHT_01594 [Puccinia striiformis]|uniref:Uncharacterized protein n=1 Tax=Puccinia striiformis TaxID=27350 RepID=A0A2S4WK80_9BASI|nr:hypothetical protein PSHT_01594 [Puccinia striiformis]